MYFEAQGLGARVQEFNVSSATVDLAAAALSCEANRIAKTLSFVWNDSAILLVAAGDAKVDNPRFKAQFGCKAKMLHPALVLEQIGHDVGGVCPFLVKKGISIYLDVSLKRFDTVFPACGSANSAVELHIPELELHAKSKTWVDVCKAWQETER